MSAHAQSQRSVMSDRVGVPDRSSNRPGPTAMAPISLPFRPSFRDDFSFSGWLDQNPDAMLITNLAGTIEYANPAFEVLSGYPPAEVLGQNASILKSGSHRVRFYRSLWRDICAGLPYRGVFVNRSRDGNIFHAESVVWPVRDGGGGIAHFASQMRNATGRMREIEILTHAATHDPLTNLPNRTLFHDRLSQALRNAARRREELAVAILDIDLFRNTNTHYGHLAGDAVLQMVARRSACCLRDTDTVARIGGDELAVILPGANGKTGAAVLKKICAANAVPVPYIEQLIPTHVSIGASIYPRDGMEAQVLCKAADSAMYAAKRAGGNGVRFHRVPARGTGLVSSAGAHQ